MREIQVPGSAPARNDKPQFWSREFDPEEAVRRLKKLKTENEIREFISGDIREGIKLAATYTIKNLQKEANESKTRES